MSSILSAIVSNVEKESQASQIQSQENGDRDNDIEDLFENCKREIMMDNNMIPREQFDEVEEIPHLKGILPQHVEVFDTVDTSTQPVTILPQGMVN